MPVIYTCSNLAFITKSSGFSIESFVGFFLSTKLLTQSALAAYDTPYQIGYMRKNEHMLRLSMISTQNKKYSPNTRTFFIH